MHELYAEMLALQNLLVSFSTGHDEDNAQYQRLRQVALGDPLLEPFAPDLLRANRNLAQFWQYIKYKHSTYAARRDYLWNEFRPALEFLERQRSAPSDQAISGAVEKLDSAHIQSTWNKALERRSTDPEGAITVARTLLESVCKHILDEAGIDYGGAPDLNKLYRLTAEGLNIAPSQHSEDVFKQILGGCTAVVEGLGALRNRLGDSHGQGRRPVQPAPRHAELAVNLAGTLAMFLLETWKARTEQRS